MDKAFQLLRKIVQDVQDAMTAIASLVQPAPSPQSWNGTSQSTLSTASSTQNNQPDQTNRALPRIRVVARRGTYPPQRGYARLRSDLPSTSGINASPSIQQQRRKVTIRRPLQAWEEYGWRRCSSSEYVGEYRVGNRFWRGRVVFPATRSTEANYDFYCYRPPEEIRRHPHSACWQHVGGGWYWIHYNIPPQDLFGGIQDIENTLAEALKL